MHPPHLSVPPPNSGPMQRNGNGNQQRERRGLPRRPGAGNQGAGHSANARAEGHAHGHVGGAKKVQVQAVPKTSVTQLYGTSSSFSRLSLPGVC